MVHETKRTGSHGPFVDALLIQHGDVRFTIFHGKIHYKWPFSIAMLVHQRVYTLQIYTAS